MLLVTISKKIYFRIRTLFESVYDLILEVKVRALCPRKVIGLCPFAQDALAHHCETFCDIIVKVYCSLSSLDWAALTL